MSKIKYYTDGVKTIRILDGQEIPYGFRHGRATSHPSWNRGLTASTSDKVRELSEKSHKTRKEHHIPAWNKGLTKESDERVRKNHNNTVDTLLKKYGVDNVSKLPHSAWNRGLTKETDKRVRKISESNKGKPSWNRGKHPKGHPQDSSTREKIRASHLDPSFKEKRYQAMKKCGTLCVHDSNAEKSFLKYLETLYDPNDIIRQYFDKERYPFKCDFYIKSEDKFIELHSCWTHGGKPFDENDEECLKKLAIWKEKAKTSRYYKIAIYNWTDLDVRKRALAKENNLNFEEIYDFVY